MAPEFPNPKFSEVLETFLDLRAAGEPYDDKNGGYKQYWADYYRLLETLDLMVHGKTAIDCSQKKV